MLGLNDAPWSFILCAVVRIEIRPPSEKFYKSDLRRTRKKRSKTTKLRRFTIQGFSLRQVIARKQTFFSWKALHKVFTTIYSTYFLEFSTRRENLLSNICDFHISTQMSLLSYVFPSMPQIWHLHRLQRQILHQESCICSPQPLAIRRFSTETFRKPKCQWIQLSYKSGTV